MSHYPIHDRHFGPVRSYYTASDQYISRPNKARRRRPVLRSSRPTIRLIPKVYRSMATADIWLIPRGSYNGQPHEEIPLTALWSSKYSRHIVHASAVRHLNWQESDQARIGTLTVRGCIKIRWTDENNPTIKWTSRPENFYVTDENLPGGAKAIIPSDPVEQSSSSSGRRMSNVIAPIERAPPTALEKQEQARRDAEARAKRERDARKEAERIEKKYQDEFRRRPQL